MNRGHLALVLLFAAAASPFACRLLSHPAPASHRVVPEHIPGHQGGNLQMAAREISAPGDGQTPGSDPSGKPLWSDGTPIRGELLVASWYGEDHRGRKTASGEVFNPDQLTAAHRTLPFGTKLKLRLNRKTVIVRINDRGPYAKDRKGRITRDLDLSLAAARELGMVRAGEAVVSVEAL